MKTLPAGLQSHLDGRATTLCWCWKVTRRDDAVQGFTEHDEDISFDGVTYEAAAGFTASEIEKALGLSIDNLMVSGALSSASLNEDDLAAGLYDGATVEIWRVNWSNTSQRLLMHTGPLGEVTRTGAAFQAELFGLAAKLNEPVGRVYGYSCDADLGDARCTVSLAASGNHGTGAVSSLISQRLFVASGLGTFDEGAFSWGKLTWTSGANDGLVSQVKRHRVSAGDVTIELWTAPSKPIGVSDDFAIVVGCDKQFETCKAKFANAANFRGYPYMIGNDAAIAHIDDNAPRDGGSRYGN